jgi:hypothetical protein
MAPGEEQSRGDCVETDFKTVTKVWINFEARILYNMEGKKFYTRTDHKGPEEEYIYIAVLIF